MFKKIELFWSSITVSDKRDFETIYGYWYFRKQTLEKKTK